MAGESVVTKIGNLELRGWDEAKYKAALTATNYPAKADTSQVNWVMAEILLVIMVIYVTMVYGPIAAFLVELFPTNIRYTSMSLPYHIGNGWFGGMLPLLATSIVAKEGNIYAGLWYPIIVSVMTFVVGSLFVHETRHVKIHEELAITGQPAAGQPARA
jgi:ATP/ADP translocase